MNLKWEYNKIRKDYTAKANLTDFSIWVNISHDQILVNVDDDDDSFSYGKFTDTVNLEERLKEVEAILDSTSTENLVDFCSQLMSTVKALK